MSVSTDPGGAIISQWLVKTLEATSQGHTSVEEEEQHGGNTQDIDEGNVNNTLGMRAMKAGSNV